MESSWVWPQRPIQGPAQGQCSGQHRASTKPMQPVQGGPVHGQYKAWWPLGPAWPWPAALASTRSLVAMGCLAHPLALPLRPSWRSRLANLAGAPGWLPRRKKKWPTTSSRAGAARVTLALAAAVGLCGPPRRQLCWCVAHSPALLSAPRWSQYKGQYKASTKRCDCEGVPCPPPRAPPPSLAGAHGWQT